VSDALRGIDERCPTLEPLPKQAKEARDCLRYHLAGKWLLQVEANGSGTADCHCRSHALLYHALSRKMASAREQADCPSVSRPSRLDLLDGRHPSGLLCLQAVIGCLERCYQTNLLAVRCQPWFPDTDLPARQPASP
jgi:hypothetical protein